MNKGRTLHRSTLCSFAAAAFFSFFPPKGVPADGPSTGSAPAESPSAEKLKKYIAELLKVSPRDADGFYQLGKWCEGQGLPDKAALAYEQAIRIDPDHALARAALGYRPLGTDWTKGAPIPIKPASTESPGDPPTASSESSRVPSPSGPASPGGASKGPAAAAGKAGGTEKDSGAKAKEGEPKPEGIKLDELYLKKRWAQDALGKLDLKFTMYEDEDFLVHSTCEANSGDLRKLTAVLKNIKKLVVNLVGRPKGPIWPGKAHFIYMRDSTQCMRFSEAIDNQRFPEEDGYYTASDPESGDHTVLSGKPPEKALGFLLGFTALEHMGNSDRYVGWWLREGVAGLVAGSTDQGKTEKVIDQAFRRAGAEIEANFEGVTIFKLLETENYKKNTGELNQCLAMTLVYFLYNLGGSKLQKLVEDLKSAEAPAKTEPQDKLFFSQYARYQENAINSNFHEKLEKLNEKWKNFVLAKASELSSKTDQKTKTGKKEKTGGGKTNTKDESKKTEKKTN